MGFTLSLVAAAVLLAPLPPAVFGPPASDDPELRAWVDEENQEFVITGGPFHLPAGTQSPDMMAPGEHEGGHSHDEHSRTPIMKVEWPVEGFMQGWKMRLHEADGTALPKEIMHHFVGVNYSRRQLAYPVAERFLAVGQETSDVELPALVGLPLEKGTELGFYAMWSNTLGRDLEVHFELRLPFTTEEPALSVMPMYLDVNNVIGKTSTFDLEPGENYKSWEFQVPVEGSVLMVGGHLHDLGKWVRLEDAVTGETLVQVNAEIGPDGRKVLDVERKILGFGEEALYLEPGRTYRLVAHYVNPMDHVMPDAAMGHMMGAFAPANYADWPRLDPASEIHRIDMSALPQDVLRVEGSTKMEDDHGGR